MPATTGLQRHWFTVGGSILLALAVLYSVLAGQPLPAEEQALRSELRAMPGGSAGPARLSADGEALLLAPGERARAVLSFTLPVQRADAPHWVLWMPRTPVRDVQVHAGDRWSSQRLSFLGPLPAEGPMPMGYMVRLPSTWESTIELEIEATGLRNAALRPQVMSEALAMRQMQRATILAVFAYASLCTLGLMGLALFYAARDWSFLSFFGFSVVSAILIATYNGHLYLFDGQGLAAGMGGSGLQLVGLVFEAACLRIVQRYADLSVVRPRFSHGMDVASVALLVVALLLALWGERFTALSAWLMPTLWAGGGVACLAVLLDAHRRRLPMAGTTLVVATAVVAAIALWEAAARGLARLDMLALYGFQVGIVVTAMLLGVGLISRIGKYRQQRDQEQRARADSERRLYREAVRVELLTGLQLRLRDADEAQIHATGLRLMLEHLRRVVPNDAALAVLRGHQSRDAQEAWPVEVREDFVAQATQRVGGLRQKLGLTTEVQHPVTRGDAPVPVAIEAALPMPGVRAPAWGLLLLERAGTTAFHPEELSIARELARIAVQQMDEAYAALRLRQTAQVDALTGSLNRHSVDQALARAFQHAHRDLQPVGVLFIDLDHFKSFNDVCGHACGDECLRVLARTMRETLGEDDIFGRYGGEEFIAILPGRQTEMARAVAESLRVAVETTEVEWEGRNLRLTVSIGVAVRMGHESLPQPTLERADKALYAAKRGGRNRVTVAPAVFSGRPTAA